MGQKRSIWQFALIASIIILIPLRYISRQWATNQLVSGIHANRYFPEEEVQRLVDRGADVDATDEDGFPVLCDATHNDSSYVVEILLKTGANMECRGPNGATPLFIAAASESSGAVFTLLRHGANVNARDHSRMSALEVVKSDTSLDGEMLPFASQIADELEAAGTKS